jgi:hypothetical protein
MMKYLVLSVGTINMVVSLASQPRPWFAAMGWLATAVFGYIHFKDRE